MVAVAAALLVIGMVAVFAVIRFGSATDGAVDSRATQTSDKRSPAEWPDHSNTGVKGCPPLELASGPEIRITDENAVFENMEIHDAVIRVLVPNATIRCVKIVGSGYFGIDNTDAPPHVDGVLTIDRVEIDCKGANVGMLVRQAIVTRANVSGCGDGFRIGGNNVTIEDSFCHSMFDGNKDVHSDCIQNTGGNASVVIRHNSLWGWDTSNILLGLESGEARDVVIDRNRLMSDPSRRPPPAFLIYVSGSGTVVTDNRFSRRFTYGPCTIIGNAAKLAWSGNVWDDDGSPVGMDQCK